MKKIIIPACFFLSGSFTSSVKLLASDAPSVAILGDSLATGAGTHAALAFDGDTLWDILKGKTDLSAPGNEAVKGYLGDLPLEPPQHLWFSRREFNGGIDWVFKHTLKRLSFNYLNTGEFSWGYLAARKSGVSSSAIFLASENGARVAALPRQADRVLDHLGGRLPGQIYILFSGNDLCAHHIKLLTPPETFKNQLSAGLRYLVRNGEPHKNGTEIIVVGFLGVTQLLVSESIQNKKVLAFGEELTCRQLREKNYQPSKMVDPDKVRNQESIFFNNMIPPNPANYCPTLFALPALAKNEIGLFSDIGGQNSEKAETGQKKDPQKQSVHRTDQRVEEMVSVLSSRIRQFRESSALAVREVREWTKDSFPKKNFHFSYVYETESLTFNADDVGPDCFHLSPAGHIKISKAVISRNPGQSDLITGPEAEARQTN